MACFTPPDPLRECYRVQSRRDEDDVWYDEESLAAPPSDTEWAILTGILKEATGRPHFRLVALSERTVREYP